RKLHIILDNLNTHFKSSFEETFGNEEAMSILKRIRFHYTPKYASWLNIAKIEINVMDVQCTDRRFEDFGNLEREVSAWTGKRNLGKEKIQWCFDRKKADKKLSKYYTESTNCHDTSHTITIEHYRSLVMKRLKAIIAIMCCDTERDSKADCDRAKSGS
ncbi:transposase, partial [mine drainage metagenome]